MNNIKFFALILCIFFAYISYSQSFDFNQYVKTNYSQFQNKYDLDKDFAATFNLRVDQLKKFDSYLMISNEIQMKFQEDTFLSSKNVKHNFYIKKSDCIILSYFEIVKTENADFRAYSWIKTFDFKGSPIDTLCILEYSDGEDAKTRMFSKIDSLSTIKINYLKSYHEENPVGPATNKVKNINISYELLSGKFICIQDKQNPIFKYEFGYKTLNDVISYHLGGCYDIQKINYGDANKDGLIDIIIELKSLKQNCNWIIFDYDILICFSNKKKEMIFIRPPMHLDLNDREFKLEGLLVNEGLITFDLIYVTDKRKISFWYEYNESSKNWFFVKAHNHFNNDWLYADKKAVLQGTKKAAMRLMQL